MSYIRSSALQRLDNIAEGYQGVGCFEEVKVLARSNLLERSLTLMSRCQEFAGSSSMGDQL